jgi:hypothetical protein
MENKYFTPDIEDICIGYELEMNWNRAYEEKWVTIKISIQDEEFAYTDEISEIINALDDGMSEARVPYLTKEQIEAEGWEHVGGKLLSGDFQDYQKDNFSMRYATDTRKLSIMVRDPSFSNEHFQVTILKAECRDINTFRKIIKLLGI